MRHRADDEEWSFPYINGSAALHDLNSEQPAPRLAGMRSVSHAAAQAMSRKPAPISRPIGFHISRR